jgi:hypothetical protein
MKEQCRKRLPPGTSREAAGRFDQQEPDRRTWLKMATEMAVPRASVTTFRVVFGRTIQLNNLFVLTAVPVDTAS